MLKKLLHITLSLLLSASIVFGYSGVGIYKMVCVAEQGKTVVSLTNVKDACKHEQEQQEASCCHPKPKQQAAQKLSSPSCCDYSFSLNKLNDETLVQNSKTHHASLVSINSIGHQLVTLADASFIQELGEANLIKGPPHHLRKQSYISFIQVFQI